ncbi:MAG: 23S rRNA (pseudouridine(1915)-N(3))-methyltransferase RlmH [Deinococcales bacterium]
MRYRLLAVGRLKRGFYASACRHYIERLAPLGRIEVVEVKEGRAPGSDAAREAESASLLAAAQGRTVALDESGRTFDTRALAAHVGELELRGTSQLSLLIGGAEGHAPWLRERVDETWSLSPLTLPHELARLVLLEQLYRVETLRTGHPYHRG